MNLNIFADNLLGHCNYASGQRVLKPPVCAFLEIVKLPSHESWEENSVKSAMRLLSGEVTDGVGCELVRLMP